MRIKRTYHCILIFFFTALPLTGIYAQSGVAYTDTSHYSPAFGHQKAYRLYLPQGYQKAGKRYPVIYFFHGWGGRHFKDDNALLEYDKIKLLVDKYQSILVMWDGNIDTTEPRPYNTGDHGDIKYMVQEKDYFPELIAHIDSAYRTLPGRQHRGIIGFSMGGFMAFFLAGKYPEKVTAAVSFAGSPEFFVGSPADHTLYPVRYAFKNLADVNIQLHNGDSDILYFLNEEVKEGAGWEDVKLDYRKFHGGHMIDKTGETTAFDMAMKFVLKSFNKKPAPKPRWSHYDLYPAFGAWDYSIQTNKKEPGYLFLRQVGKTGFGFYTRKWLPDGPPVNIDSAMVSTAAIYKPGRQYRIIIYESKTGKLQEDLQKADTSGRLSFNNAPETETGIYEEGDNASFIFLDHTTRTNSRYLQNRKSGSLSLRLFNRAGTRPWPEKINVTLYTNDKGIRIKKNAVVSIIQPNQRIISLPPFTVRLNKPAPHHAEPPQAKFKVAIRSGNEIFTDDFIVPVLYESPEFNSIKVDDQVPVRERTYGKGNGNGIADAGEHIMLYSSHHRLRLYTADKWVIREEEQATDEVIPAKWPDGFTLSSVVKISPDCPDGHVIEFYASFETKTFNPIERKTTWGKVNLVIQNKTSTKKY